MPPRIPSQEKVQQIARSWTNAWNTRDLDSLIAHYAENVTFMSPTVITRDGDPSGRIQGRDALEEHFREGLESFGPNVSVTLIDACVGVDGYALYHERETGAKVIVAKRSDNDDKIIEARVHYHSST